MANIVENKIKIVRVIARLNIGGPALHTVILCAGLDKKRFETTFVIGKPDEKEGDMSYLANDRGVHTVYIPELKREIGLADIAAFFKILSVILKTKPEIVHTHTAKAGVLGRIAALFARTPVVIHTFHGHVFDGYFKPFMAKVFIMIERFLAVFTDRVIAVSASVKDELVNKLKITIESKCAVIPLGFDLEKFLTCEKKKGSFRREIGVGPDIVLIGIVGRLVAIKNHRMFLAAAKKMMEKGFIGKVKFVIVGDGELRPSLEAGVKDAGLESHVIFTGWILDLDSVYADLDIVTLTSLNEGTPVSLIEAMASARPVVAADVGGVRDIVKSGENGFLVRRDDVEDFISKLAVLIEDSNKRTDLGIRGRASVREAYSQERLLKDTERLYQELLTIKTKNTGV